MAREFLTPVVLPADPVAPMEASTRQFADEVFIGKTDPYVADPNGKWELWVVEPLSWTVTHIDPVSASQAQVGITPDVPNIYGTGFIPPDYPGGTGHRIRINGTVMAHNYISPTQLQVDNLDAFMTGPRNIDVIDAATGDVLPATPFVFTVDP
jgi:hypothetical protein